MNPVEPPRLELTGVTKSYDRDMDQPISALRGIDLTIGPGEFVSIEGPSGCGKTTLLNLLGLLDGPSSGTFRWNGEDVARWRERDRARRRLTAIGFIFQRFYLLPTLSAEENVELPMRALGLPRPERKARAAELLTRVGLRDRRRSFPHQLSGGEEQRVAVARALANGAGLLLADEPTGELDSVNTEGILELLVETQKELGATVVLVTHNPRVAGRARRHLAMTDGLITSDRNGA